MKNDIAERKFRDYATRVSFSLSLTRNQIAVLRAVRDLRPARDNYKGTTLSALYKNNVQEYDGRDMWVPGAHKMIEMGLVEHYEDERKVRCLWRLTEIGEIVCDLLVRAQLMPPLVAEKQRRRA